MACFSARESRLRAWVVRRRWRSSPLTNPVEQQICNADREWHQSPAPLPSQPVSSLKSDQERIDYLIKQNQMLIEVIKSLKAESDRPKTKEEAFAACMQAAKGATNPMSAESIGGHCDQLLKKS